MDAIPSVLLCSLAISAMELGVIPPDDAAERCFFRMSASLFNDISNALTCSLSFASSKISFADSGRRLKTCLTDTEHNIAD